MVIVVSVDVIGIGCSSIKFTESFTVCFGTSVTTFVEFFVKIGLVWFVENVDDRVGGIS